ncbi:c-type cytochrome [Aquisalimonas lutea]|uniref:c-type cytochrome n=1 Tax=Aquisalimonas lutea TaxID=1327750 RepID=UPI0025B459D4|nr:c-type cytochrome [Aquisalimonas lutea]MDN3516403.1 c-type cytochrome [Aquisalimonas lutea]
MSSEQDDKAFMKSFGGVILLLVVGAIIIALLAVFASTFEPSRNQARIELERERMEERLQPVGRVREDGDPAPISMGSDEEEDGGGDEGPMAAADVYESTCMACHDSGVMEAPITGENEPWASRYQEKGLDTLVEHAINGFNAMPARGGDSSLSDQEVHDAVVYMLEQSGVEVNE